MCLCQQSAVHIYNSHWSFRMNVLGFDPSEYWQAIFRSHGVAENRVGPIVNRFGPIDCECVHGYLPTAILGSGLFSIAALLLAAAIWFVLITTANYRLALQLSVGWLILTLVGIGLNLYTWSELWALAGPDGLTSTNEHFVLYLWSIPAQLVFNMAVFLIVPAGIIAGIRRLRRPGTG